MCWPKGATLNPTSCRRRSWRSITAAMASSRLKYVSSPNLGLCTCGQYMQSALYQQVWTAHAVDLMSQALVRFHMQTLRKDGPGDCSRQSAICSLSKAAAPLMQPWGKATVVAVSALPISSPVCKPL